MALSGVDASWDSRLADEVLLWVLVTGLYVTLNQPEEEWFTSRATDVASELGIHDLTDLNEFRWRFLHRVDASHETCLSLLAVRLRSIGDTSPPSIIAQT